MKRFVRLAGAALLSLFCSTLFAAESPATVAGATTIDTGQALALFDQEVAFVDVRKDSDWDAGRIPGAIHLDVKKALSEESLASEVKKDEPVVFYCNGHNCLRSSHAATNAVKWGWKKVSYYRDGFPAWKTAGNPVE